MHAFGVLVRGGYPIQGPREIMNRYFDTPGLLIADSKYRIRLRVELGMDSILTVKAPADDLLAERYPDVPLKLKEVLKR